MNPNTAVTGYFVLPYGGFFASGATQQFAAFERHANGESVPVTENVVWSSTDEAIFTVGANDGLMTAISNGNANIQFRLESDNPGDVKASAPIVIMDNPPVIQSLELVYNPLYRSSLIVDPNTSLSNPFDAVLTLDDGTEITLPPEVVNYSMSKPHIYVSGYNQLMVGADAEAGEVTITGEYMGLTATETFTVSRIPISMRLDAPDPVYLSEEFDINVFITFNDGLGEVQDDSLNAIWEVFPNIDSEIDPTSNSKLGKITLGSVRIYSITCSINGTVIAKDSINRIPIIRPPYPVSTYIEPSDAVVKVGNTQQFIAYEVMSDGSRRIKSPAFFSVNDETYATITTAGLLTGVAEGNATVNVASTQGGASEANVTVTINDDPVILERIEFSQTEQFSYKPGVLYVNPFTVIGYYSDGSEQTLSNLEVAFTSSNPGVVFGVVAGIARTQSTTDAAYGEFTVTATYETHTATTTAFVLLSVTQVNVTGVPSSGNISPGQTFIQHYTFNFNDGRTNIIDATQPFQVIQAPYYYEFIQGDSASIECRVNPDLGVPNSFYIQVYFTDVPSTIAIPTIQWNVIDAPPVPVLYEIRPNNKFILTIGDTQAFELWVTYDDSTEERINPAYWTSEDDAIFTVDATGLVTAVALGQATLSAAQVDGGSIVATGEVIVTDPPGPVVTGHHIEGPTTVARGETITLTAWEDYDDGSKLQITSVDWSSNNTPVATINPGGVVAGIAGGQTTISFSQGAASLATYEITVTGAPDPLTIDYTPKTDVHVKPGDTGTSWLFTYTATYTDGTSGEVPLNQLQVYCNAGVLYVDTSTGNWYITTNAKAQDLIVTARFTNKTAVSVQHDLIIDKVPVQIRFVNYASQPLRRGFQEEWNVQVLFNDEAGWTTTDAEPVTWSSNDSDTSFDAASNSSKGISRSMTPNVEVTLTVTHYDYSNVTASIIKTVQNVDRYPVSWILDPIYREFVTGTTTTFVPYVNYSDGSREIVSPAYWLSSNEAVATVNQSGQASWLTEGQSNVGFTTYPGGNIGSVRTMTVDDTIPVDLKIVPTGSMTLNPATTVPIPFEVYYLMNDGSQGDQVPLNELDSIIFNPTSVTVDVAAGTITTNPNADAGTVYIYVYKYRTVASRSLDGQGTATIATVVRAINIIPHRQSMGRNEINYVEAYLTLNDGRSDVQIYNLDETWHSSGIAAGAITFTQENSVYLELRSSVAGPQGTYTVFMTMNDSLGAQSNTIFITIL